jgi:hypothetical protein
MVGNQMDIGVMVVAFGIAAALLASTARAGAATDPCRLLAASEAQTYVGVLTTPPFRANDDGAADARGAQCAYRGSGGRRLMVTWNGPSTLGSAMGGAIPQDSTTTAMLV